LESAIGHAVQYVTFGLAALGIFGCGVFLYRHGGASTSFEHVRVFTGEPQDWRSLAGIVAFDKDQLSGRGLGQLAIALFLLIPVGRVAASGVLFRRQGYMLQMGMSVAVLAILLYSLLCGR
jgi:hypothetical protein